MSDFTGDESTLSKRKVYVHQEYPMWVTHVDPKEKAVLCSSREERIDFYKGLTAAGREELEDAKEKEKALKAEDLRLELEMSKAQSAAMEEVANAALSELEKSKIAAKKELSNEMDYLQNEAEKEAKKEAKKEVKKESKKDSKKEAKKEPEKVTDTTAKTEENLKFG